MASNFLNKRGFLNKNILMVLLAMFVFLTIVFLGNSYNKNKNIKLFEEGYYTEATVINYTKQTRSSFYEYVFEYNENLSSPRKSYYSGYNLEVGGKYIVLINPNKLDESLLLHPFSVPDSLQGKNIVWKEIPPFLDREEVLKFVKEY